MEQPQRQEQDDRRQVEGSGAHPNRWNQFLNRSQQWRDRLGEKVLDGAERMAGADLNPRKDDPNQDAPEEQVEDQVDELKHTQSSMSSRA